MDKVKLPVIGSSAASTTFCAAEVRNPADPDRVLWIDGNSKVTAWNGTYEDPKPNAFSLEAEAVARREGTHTGTCPGSTSVCRASCYVHGLEKHAGETYDLYRQNSKTIREILDEPFEVAIDWADTMAAWIDANAKGGFRWHVSGDVFSSVYARWIAHVVERSPRVNHWIYTRSFDRVAPLLELRNLSLNLSCDRENIDAAREFAEACWVAGCRTMMQLCYLTDDGTVPPLPTGSVIFPDYELRGRGLADPTDSEWWKGLTPAHRKMVCGVDFFGKSETMRCGPCRKCLL